MPLPLRPPSRIRPLVQVEEALFRHLKSKINPQRKAKDLMTYPVKSLAPDETIEHANELLTRYNVNVLLVIEEEKLLGWISRQVVEKAIFHGLKDLPVREYMNTEVAAVDPRPPCSRSRNSLSRTSSASCP